MLATSTPPSDAITVERFTVAQNNGRLDQLVECYRAVFAGHPWNEWRVCPVCRKKWGISERQLLGDSFEHCGVLVNDYWPASKVLSDIRHEITEKASCWVTILNNNVIGFCWGYPTPLAGFDEKLGLPGAAHAIRSAFGDAELVAYQDELGVLEAYRGRGLAKAMYLARRQDFLSQGLTIGTVRTKRTPPSVTYSWFVNKGYKVVAEYHDADDKVILASNIDELQM